MDDFWAPLLGTVWEVRLESCYPHPIAEVVHVDRDRLLFRSEGRLRAWWAHAATVMDPLAGYHYIGTLSDLSWIKQDAFIIHKTTPSEDIVLPFAWSNELVPPMPWEVLGWDWSSGRVIFRTYGWRGTEFFSRNSVESYPYDDLRSYTTEIGPRWGTTLLHVAEHYRPAVESEWQERSRFIDRLRTRVDPTWNQPPAATTFDLNTQFPLSALALRSEPEPEPETIILEQDVEEEPMAWYEVLHD